MDRGDVDLAKLNLDRLTPYTRTKVEKVLVSISAAENNLDEAREHLVNAIESGGLNEDEFEQATGAAPPSSRIAQEQSRIGQPRCR